MTYCDMWLIGTAGMWTSLQKHHELDVQWQTKRATHHDSQLEA